VDQDASGFLRVGKQGGIQDDFTLAQEGSRVDLRAGALSSEQLAAPGAQGGT
jgi:hypothetical protein